MVAVQELVGCLSNLELASYDQILGWSGPRLAERLLGYFV